MNLNELESKTIDFVRFPLAIFIVFWHMNPKGTPLVDNLHLFSAESLRYILEVGISSQLVQIAVPVFFMISGYLFFKNINSKKLWGGVKIKIRKRTFSLFIPYMLWNTIAIIVTIGFMVLRTMLKSHNWNEILDYIYSVIPLGYWVFSARELSATNIVGIHYMEFTPVDAPLWFVRDLMVMVLISPLIHHLIKRFSKIALIVLSICFITGLSVHIPGLEIRAILFFSLGVYFSIHTENMVLSIGKISIWCYIITIISFVLALYYGKNYAIGMVFHNIYVLFGSLSILPLISILIRRKNYKMPRFLTRSCFFVYSMHTICILGYMKAIMNKILPWDNTVIDILRFYATPLLTVSFIVIIYWIVEKKFPKIASVLSGGR